MGWLSDCSDKTFCVNAGGCSQGAVLMFEKAYTNCIFNNDVDYSYKIDLNNNGGIEINSPNDTCTGNFPIGTHKIYWRATDDCGNVVNCTYLFTVKDCTPPNMLCINGLTQNIDPLNCLTTFTPQQFIMSVSDNCTPANQLQFGIREAGTGTGFPDADSLSFGECDLGLNFVEIWVRDGNGLMNICQNYVLVQQNGTNCICNPDAEVMLSGCVKTSGNKKMSTYAVRSTVESLSGVSPPVVKTKNVNMTDSCFALETTQLPFGGQYRATLSASRGGDPKEGVSTFDLVLMSKHILGVDPFTNVYQWLGSDVNKSNSVTTFDIVETRKLLLGIYDTFPNNSSWRVIRPIINPADFGALATVKDTYQIMMPSLNDDIGFQNLNFVGIKIGDANLSASLHAPEAEDREPLWLTVEDRWVQAGERLEIPVRWGQTADLEGFQLSLRIDPALARLETVGGLPDDQYHILPDGSVRLLGFGPEAQMVGEGTPVLSLNITAVQQTRLSDMLYLQPESLKAEAYSGDSKKHVLQLRFASAGNAGDWQVFGPSPNPAADWSRLEVHAPAAQEINLSLFDTFGQRVFSRQANVEKGVHFFDLPLSGLPSGMLVWRLDTGGRVLSGKMVKL